MMEKIIITETIIIQTEAEASRDELAVLKSAQDDLNLAGEELKRMEDEGGVPMNKEQAAKAEAFTKAGERIGKAIPLYTELNPSSPYEI
jgi:hypothetical protein